MRRPFSLRAGLTVGAMFAVLAVLLYVWLRPAVPAPASPAQANVQSEALAAWVQEAASAVAVPKRAAAAQHPAPGHWDLCGIGRVPTPPGAAASSQAAFNALDSLPAHLGEQALEIARSRMLAELPSAGPRGQALALLMQPQPGEALVALAKLSADPAVMQWALMRCLAYRKEGACAGLAARDLTRLAPDNAIGWLLLAEQEPRAQAEWTRGLRAAKRVDHYPGFMAQEAWQSVPGDLPDYLRMALAVEAIGVFAALPDPTLSLAFKHCRPAPAAQSPRQAECDALARLMLESSDTLGARMVGARLGELAGWPAERVMRERKAVDRAINALVASTTADPQPLSCRAVQNMQRWIEDTTAGGEMQAALRMQAAASAPR